MVLATVAIKAVAVTAAIAIGYLIFYATIENCLSKWGRTEFDRDFDAFMTIVAFAVLVGDLVCLIIWLVET